MRVRALIVVSGMVQGVGFRYFTHRCATRLGLGGYVRNLPSGEVELQVEGDRSLVEEYIQQVKVGPSFARVADVRVEWLPADRGYQTFEVRY